MSIRGDSSGKAHRRRLKTLADMLKWREGQLTVIPEMTGAWHRLQREAGALRTALDVLDPNREEESEAARRSRRVIRVGSFHVDAEALEDGRLVITASRLGAGGEPDDGPFVDIHVAPDASSAEVH